LEPVCTPRQRLPRHNSLTEDHQRLVENWRVTCRQSFQSRLAAFFYFPTLLNYENIDTVFARV
jgi:hypothetical protein